MSSLQPFEKTRLERLFEMNGGYVLNFRDSTFGQFFSEVANIDIHSAKYCIDGTSKAKKLRAFWYIESDLIVGKVILALIEMWENNSNRDPDSGIRANECRDIARRLLTSGGRLDDLKETVAPLDVVHLTEQICRMESAIENDPALAIGSAKELIETVCKTILAERGKPVTGKPDIPSLTKSTFKELNLVPDGVRDEAKGAETIRVLLSNLSTIASRLAELRNLYGTGHGKDGKARGLTPRHARLAVGTASTLAMFLFETHSQRSEI
ncbi:MAG TPA: abortive infection family protein [Candidatus Sumerlaeota bacterium]|nr:abortive infection family protein [Candidatus Sumerlaeota bacterium]